MSTNKINIEAVNARAREEQTPMTKIPRKQKRCEALFIDGSQCRKRTLLQHHYHGNTGIYGHDQGCVAWVKIYVCIEHAIAIGYDFTKTQPPK